MLRGFTSLLLCLLPLPAVAASASIIIGVDPPVLPPTGGSGGSNLGSEAGPFPPWLVYHPLGTNPVAIGSAGVPFDFATSCIEVLEEAGQVLIPIFRNGTSSGPLQFSIVVTDGRAKAGQDYLAPTVSQTLAEGVNSMTVAVPILADSEGEINEEFLVSIGPAGWATWAGSCAVVRIIDQQDYQRPSATFYTGGASYYQIIISEASDATLPVRLQGWDSHGVASMRAKVNDGPYQEAHLIRMSPFTSMRPGERYPVFQVDLTGPFDTGPVKVTAECVDTRGRVSDPVTMSVPVARLLKIARDAGGTVPELPETCLCSMGTSFTVTATPEAGYFFAGWSIESPHRPEAIGVQPSALEFPALTFIHQGGLMLRAKFVPNPFAGPYRTYHGLVRSDTPGLATYGCLTATVQRGGALTGKLTLGGQTHALRAILSGNGTALLDKGQSTSLVIPRPGKPPLHVSFALDLTGSDEIHGTVTQEDPSGAELVSTIEAYRAWFNGSTRIVPAEYLGARQASATYTMVMAQAETQHASLTAEEMPPGFSFGTIRVAKNGVVSFTGLLADGSRPVTMSAPLSQSLRCPLFAPLYGRQGFLSALLQLDHTQKESDITSLHMEWCRPVGKTGHWASGWPAAIRLDLAAAKYLVTRGQSIVPVQDGYYSPDDEDDCGDALPGPAAVCGLSFFSPSMSDMDISVSIGTADSVRILTPGHGVSLAIHRRTGRITGALTHPVYKTRAAYRGMIYQKGAATGAYGFFSTSRPSPQDAAGGYGGVILYPPAPPTE